MKKQRKQWKRLLALLMVLTMCVAVLPGAALATDDEDETSTEETTESSKTLTVGSSGDYTVIQEAINYIYGLTDEDGAEDGWTINVEAGTYARFVVQPGVDNLTIIGAGGATVIKTLCDDGITVGKTDACGIYKANKVSADTQGIIVDYAGGFTLKNVKITMGTNSTSWKSSAIALANGDTTMEADNGFTLDSCSIEGAGVSEYSTGGMGVFVDNKCDVFTIKNCTFTGCLQAIYYENTHSGPESVTIANNTFTDCSFAFHGSWSSAPVSGSTGSFTMSGNTVTGSGSLRNKIVIQDTNNLNAVKVTISGNTLNYGLIGTINLQAEDDNNVLSSNNFGTSSFYVDAVEPGSIDVTYASYQAPNDNSAGYWAVTGIDDLEVDWGKNPEGTLEAVQAAIAAANDSGSRVLNITGLDSTGDGDIDTLIKTFTWFKDAIYWVSGAEKTSEPGMDKVIIEDDGTETGSTTAAAGDVIDFELRSTIPEDMDVQEDAAAPTLLRMAASYTMTFHDQMDEILELVEDRFEVTIIRYEIEDGNIVYVTDTDEDGNTVSTPAVAGTVTVPDTYYTVTTAGLEDECTFEVTVNLLALYQDGKITSDDLGSAAIVVSYSATLSEGATAGTYENTAWVEWPDHESEKDTVTVDTYGIKIFKYDQSAKDEDGEYVGLAGATFELQRVIDTTDGTVDEATDDDGNTTYTYTVTDGDGKETSESITVYKGENTVETEGEDGNTSTEPVTYYYDISYTLVSGADGYVTVEGLDAGTYYLVETKAPNGYVCSDVALEIVIPADADTNTTEGSDTYNLVSVQFANSPVPGTGGTGTAMYTTVGVIILLAAGCVFLFSRKKRESD